MHKLVLIGLVLLIILCISVSFDDSELYEDMKPLLLKKKCNCRKEHYKDEHQIYGRAYSYGSPWYGFWPLQSLFWNSTRGTRNMSYDLRGDVPTPIGNIGPFWRSPLI